MSIDEHLSHQDPQRQPLLRALHETILANDPTVTATIGKMMGKEMILYNCEMFKYGLASVKDYMSLHCMPIYMNAPMHVKYEALLPNANFQKGCINFKNEAELPLAVATELITDCAKIDLKAIMEKYRAERKKK
ncbi:hypothetical protein BEL04_03135 [Mucilaginibacter sp. PPCGB 2223]|uniref:DUF1801 domain-containing protein n=1 Tax=Mucilaginibacter sp. PPCGB 2223 TaxID=1886027 RepID=UPI0008244DD6|nr:DUF1801 domain-containing protein [Mucilaginibacter sp. PPCGB 2223]OCX53313.1 hypothetical protein BEL04_03135 [Mucilaginibacter sp. PPCGB 2223]